VLILFFFFLIHLFTCANIVWAISSPHPDPPLPSYPPHPPRFQAETVLPFSPILLMEVLILTALCQTIHDQEKTK
jgi:hypothetical protein